MARPLDWLAGTWDSRAFGVLDEPGIRGFEARRARIGHGGDSPPRQERSEAGMIQLIAAIDKSRGMADDHAIPWQGKIPTDTRYFRDQTAEGTIVMGYRTYEEYDHPLHDRQNFVVSRPGTSSLREGFVALADLASFLHVKAHSLVWVIGGAGIFAQSISLADALFITQLDDDFHCTKFFPKFDDDFLLANDLGPHRENGISFRFQIWRRQHDVSEQFSRASEP
jgi:dihydrofolate reductase